MTAVTMPGTRSGKVRLRPVGYWLVFTVPALMPLSWWLVQTTGSFLWTALPIVWLYGLLPLTDWLIGRDRQPPVDSQDTWLNRRLVPWLCLPVQIAVVFGSLAVLPAMPWWAGILWILSLGYVGSVLAINVAHELIHRKSRVDRTIGGLLLSTVNYATFKIEHVRGHHVWVATENDPSSAQRGDIVYKFVPRALIRNTINGWRLEAERLRRMGKSPVSLRNELIGWQLVVIAFAVVAWLLAGWVGVAAFLLQGLVAAGSLEVINYVEHYGLKRRQLENGRYERPAPRHSWNSDFWLSNGMLLQLQRHSDHHAFPSRPFTQLRSWPDAPQLPLGYSAMLPITFIPPLYRRLIHPRLDALNARTG
ncbi:MAG TPA: alkane 1-monooxygenase [Wenzhouxiangellaceae bacterium]|nr:alkane 1-monooxygenase [Wenzhouxiangellaceae bacterium]